MSTRSNFYIKYVINFILELTCGGFGVTAWYNNKKPDEKFMATQTKKKLNIVKEFLQRDDVIKYFKKDKIEFITQIVSLLEKIEPEVIYSTGEISVVYRANMPDKMVDDLVFS